MPLTSQQVLDIIRDDERFIKHVRPDSAELDVKFVEIPRSSFTADKLLHASPVELSLSSKVTLLGGVPTHWFNEQRLGFWKMIPHVELRQVDRNIRKLDEYGYRLTYSKKSRRKYGNGGGIDKKPPINDQCSARGQEVISSIKESRTIGAIPVTSKNDGNAADETIENIAATPIKVQERSTIPVLPKIHIGRKQGDPSPYESQRFQDPEGQESSEQNQEDKKLISRSLTDSTLITNISNTQSFDECCTTQSDSCCTNPNHEIFFDNTDVGKSPGDVACGEFSLSAASEPHSPTDYSEMLSCSDSDSYMLDSESSPSELFQDAMSSIPMPNNNLSPSFGMQLDGSSHSVQTQENSADNIIKFEIEAPTRRFSSRDARRSSYCDSYTGKSRLVRLKSTAASNSTELMRVLSPTPREMDTNLGNSSSSTKLNVDRYGKRNRKIQRDILKEVQNGLSSLFRSSETHHISSKRLRNGKIIFAEKMLMMQKTAVDRKEPFLHFSEVEPVDTRVSERWKEYIVVIRLTNIAYKPLLIQFYKQDYIPKKLEKSLKLKRASLDFLLDRQCKVDFYSNLDKTICIQKPDERYSGIIAQAKDPDFKDLSSLRLYILRCRTLFVSSQLFEILRRHLGYFTIPKQLILRVPDADISISMRINATIAKCLLELEAKESENMKIMVLPRGYKVFQYPLMRYIAIAVTEELRRGGFFEILKKWEKSNMLLGCCFKRYDLLQWSSGKQNVLFRNAVALYKSHLIEYRPYTYQERQIKTDTQYAITEPTPIEGFLIRVTDKYGQEKRASQKLFLQPSYFFTTDGLIFYMKSFKAIPPAPIGELLEKICNGEDIEGVKKLLQDWPSIYEDIPYPLDLSGHISWLKDKLDEGAFDEHDFAAFKAFKRRVIQMLKAEGIIDMSEIKEIYRNSGNDIGRSEIKYQVYNKAKKAFWHSDESLGETADSIICIKTKNNLVLKLLAPDPEICGEWISRLKDLVTFFSAEKSLDCEKVMKIRLKNLQNLKLQEEEESNMNCTAPKWLTDRAITDATIYNANAFSGLRPLLHQGLLYQKPKKHSTFSKYLVLLVPGFLIFYHSFHRSTTGFAKNVLNHSRYLTISLENCYIYSGNTSELDLLKRDHTFDELNPGSHSLPRYYSDGWRSAEDETSRCFTLWFGGKRTFRATKKQDSEGADATESVQGSPTQKTPKKTHKKLHVTNKLGVAGKSMVFMARSRQERNLWVLSIYYELERLSKSEIA